jgi:CDP-diacylglycerol--glycerol-3-phosphate 3-phosphatidyltransferase
VTPNMVSALGFAGALGAAVLVARGEFLVGGIVMLVAGALDLVDGALARATGRVTAFGAVFDATLDRLSEAAILGGLLFHFSQGGHRQELILVYVALVGSLMVSYLRARAQIAGIDLREGLFTRPERVILLALGLIIDQTRIVLWILAVLANFTALQRLFAVWRRLDRGGEAATGDEPVGPGRPPP